MQCQRPLLWSPGSCSLLSEQQTNIVSKKNLYSLPLSSCRVNVPSLLYYYTLKIPPLWHLSHFICLLVHSLNVKHPVVRYCARHWGQSVEQDKVLLAWASTVTGDNIPVNKELSKIIADSVRFLRKRRRLGASGGLVVE